MKNLFSSAKSFIRDTFFSDSMSDSPIIVFGAPRSGTTYLCAILNSHPDVFITHETRLFAWAHHAIHSLPSNPQMLLSHKEEFLNSVNQNLPGMIKMFYKEMKQGVKHWGDKNPHYASTANKGCLDTIRELFPCARFVHVIRDGRNVVASLIRKKTPKGKKWTDFEDAHRIWKSHVNAGREFGTRIGKEFYYEIKYENLVKDDVKEAKALMSFLNIDFHPEVEIFCENQQKNRAPFSGPTRDLKGDILKSEWAEILTPSDQLESLRKLDRDLVRWGYESNRSIKQIYKHLSELNG